MSRGSVPRSDWSI